MRILNYIYIVYFVIFLIGVYGSIACANLIKKVIALSIAQTGIILLYISVGYRYNHLAAIYSNGAELFVDPLPQVLMLTAIVVGISVTAIGLAIAVNIKKAFNTINEDELEKLDIN